MGFLAFVHMNDRLEFVSAVGDWKSSRDPKQGVVFPDRETALQASNDMVRAVGRGEPLLPNTLWVAQKLLTLDIHSEKGVKARDI